MSVETKTIFDQVYDQTEEELASEERVIKKDELKDQFTRQFDSASKSLISLKRNQANMLKDKFTYFNLNDYRRNESEIKDYELAKEDIADHYFKFFGEKINR